MATIIRVIVLALTIGILSGSTALAATPVRNDISIPVGTQLPFDDICQFSVQGTILQDSEGPTCCSSALDGRSVPA